MMNFKNPLFQDIRVRRALSMGMNREQIWSGGMDKTGVVGAAPIPFDFYVDDYFPPPSSEYGPNAQYNPEQAKQLLREAGLTPPIRLQIYQTPNQPAAWQGSLDTIVFNWKQAGVAEAELVVRDALVWSQDRLNRTWPDLLYTCCGLISGYELNSLVAPTFLPDSPANYGSVDDPVLTDLLEKLLVLTDPNEVPKLARQMAEQIVENVDHLWFTWIQGIEIDHPWLHGMVMSNHNCVNGIGWGNYKYVWMGENAPDGRGGKPI
jgi:peptide/nickel transport system substrate-binding protein